MLLALALSLVAQASAPASLAVVPQVVAGGEAALGPADVLGAVEQAAARRPTVRVVNALDALSAEEARQVRDCGPDAQCVGGVLRASAVPAALLVIVNARVSPPVIGIRAVVDGVVQGERIDSRAAQEVPLREAIGRAAAQVLDALGHPQWAELTLDVTPRPVVLNLDVPEAMWRSTTQAWVPPGTVTLRVEAPDHETATVTLALAAGEARTVTLALERDDPWWRSGWVWGAIGAGIVAGVVVTALAVPGGEPCLCVGFPGEPCGCE